jgi:hypothetical protein
MEKYTLIVTYKNVYMHILQKINVSPVPKHHILLHFVPAAYHKSLVEPHSRSQEKVLINWDSNTGRHSYQVE